MSDQPITSPILARKRIAGDVADIREQLGLSQAELARQLDVSGGTVGMVESRERIPSEEFLEKLMRLCGREDELDELLAVRTVAKRREPQWRGIDSGAYVLGFDEYVSLEGAAERIDEYETRLVPGLLQTREYAWASLSTRTEGSTQRRFEIRMSRQEILSRGNPVILWVILEEQALDRPVGSSAIMRAQFEHLLTLPERSGGRVTIQVCPTEVGPHVSLSSSFTLLRFASPRDPGVVAVETRVRTIFFERPAEVQQYVYEMDHLRTLALSPEDSAELIKRKHQEV